MAIKVENDWLPGLSVARYFVATKTPFLHVEHPSFNQLVAKKRPINVFVHVAHIFKQIHCMDKKFRDTKRKKRKLTENKLSLSKKLILYGKSPVFTALRDPVGHRLV